MEGSQFKALNSLWGCWPSGQIEKSKETDEDRVSEAAHSSVAQNWPWGGQITNQKHRDLSIFD